MKEIEKVKSVTESDKIWEEIKDLPIAMFALPGQTIKDHVVKVEVEPSGLFLRAKSSAVIAALEDALNMRFDRAGNITKADNFTVEQIDTFIVVRRSKK